MLSRLRSPLPRMSLHARLALPLLGVAAAGALLAASAPASGDIDPEIPPEDPIGEVEDTASDVLDEVTDLTCELTDIPTICKLNILTYVVRTDYRRPDDTHRIRYTGALINVPTSIDASGDLLPDLNVTVTALTPTHVRLAVQRTLFAPKNFPLTVEALIDDPSTQGRLINVGYDTQATSAPKRWTAKAALLTGLSTKVDAEIEVNEPPSSMSVLGGLYVPGEGEERLHPKQARLTYTPVPATSTIAFSLEKTQKTGAVSTATPTKAELDLLLLQDGEGQHVNATLHQLNKPVGVLLDEVDENGNQAETGDTHVRVTTQNDVTQAGLVYEQVTDIDGQLTDQDVFTRVRVKAGPMPAQTDVVKTQDGVRVDTDAPVALAAGGVATGRLPIGDDPGLPVPTEAPLESPFASYVHHDTTAGVESTTFRVAGVEHVDVATTGTDDDKLIEIGARLASAPLNVRVTDDTEGGSLYDVDIKDLPHNLWFTFAAKRTRLLDFCGSSNDAEDPCSPEGQAAPAGIDTVVMKPSHTAKAIFGRATHLDGIITGIPSTLSLDVDKHVPVDDLDPDQNTKVHIDASRAIGHVTLRATDGTLPLLEDPADNGLVYQDTAQRYAVIAKVDGFRRAHLDTEPSLALELHAEAGHTFTAVADLPTADGPLHADATLPGRPARTAFSLTSVEDGPTTVTVSGATSVGLPTPTPKVLFNMVKPTAIFGGATHLHADVTDIPSPVTLTVDAATPDGPDDPNQDTRVYVDSTSRIGSVLLRAHDGGELPTDPGDNGVVYRDTPTQYAVVAKVDGFLRARLDSKPGPILDLDLRAAGGHSFTFDAKLPTDDGQLVTHGSLPDRPAETQFSLVTADVTTITVTGRDSDGVLVPTPEVVFNLQNPKAIFGRATQLSTEVTDIPSPVTLTIDSDTPDGPDDPDQDTKVHIDADKPIGHVVLSASDGSPEPTPPAVNGVIYRDADTYGVAARVDGFERAHLDLTPDQLLDVELRAEEGHDFEFAVDVMTDDGLLEADGFLLARPHRTDFELHTLDPEHRTLYISGATAEGAGADTPLAILDLVSPTALFAEATHLHADAEGVPADTELVIDTVTEPGLDVDIVASNPIGSVYFWASDGGDLPPGPQDTGVVYQDQPGEPYALIGSVDGFEEVHLQATEPLVEASLVAEPGHTFSYAIHLPPDEDKPAQDFTGFLQGRPASTTFSIAKDDKGTMTITATGEDEDGNDAGIQTATLDAHLSDAVDDKVHDVAVELQDIPPTMVLTKKATAAGEVDIDVATTGGPLGYVDVELRNPLGDPSGLPLPLGPDQSGINVISDDNETADKADDRFYVRAVLKKLEAVSFGKTDTGLDAVLAVGEKQDFRIWVDKGIGPDHKPNVNNCENWHSDEHNGPHQETHHVLIKPLQLDTEFHYKSGEDGNGCHKWREITYDASGNADNIFYRTSAGDVAAFEAVVGQGNTLLPVPPHIDLCQAASAHCFEKINRKQDCYIAGDYKGYCSTSHADQSINLETFGEKAHVQVLLCLVNKDPDNVQDCKKDDANKGVFADLVTAHLDVGYNYDKDCGCGFLTENTQPHTDDGQDPVGPNLGVNGRINYLNHLGALKFANINFGYEGDSRGDPETNNSSFHNHWGAFFTVAPVPGVEKGSASCVNDRHVFPVNADDSYLNFVLHDSEDAQGLLLTRFLCGPF